MPPRQKSCVIKNLIIEYEVAKRKDERFSFYRSKVWYGENDVDHNTGGVLASTWVLKHKEHTGADEDLDKNVHFVIGNDYALAA